MKRYTVREIRRTLAKYDLQTTLVPVAEGRVVEVVEARDAYSLLDQLVAREELGHRTERFPYWAEVWPAGVALARWFHAAGLPRPATPVLELGCGLGLVGISLALLGWETESTDFVEDALILTAHNARLTRTALRHRVGYLDWAQPVGTPTLCVAGSDLAYEKRNHPLLAGVLRELLLPGGTFYLSDPQRPAARAFVELLRERGYSHEVETVLQPWKSLEHRVDIHRFVRPAEGKTG
ncbi:MAG: hypothetical protein WDA75_08230 [Candidatus Latescibacterota bacterium]|jgi:predicted nicotinamide N-methyase